MNRHGKTAGVMGGLGPEACLDFMATVLRLTPAEKEQDHVRLLVDQNPQVPNRQDAIIRGAESPAPALVEMAMRLSNSGCDFIVMPCNTAHAYEADIRAACTVPFVSIIDVTVAALPDDATAVGILATPACMLGGMFQNALAASGRECVELNQSELEEMMRLVQLIKRGDADDNTRRGLKSLADKLILRGAQAIIIGCTEIPIVLSQTDVDVALISSTEELAKTTIAMARGESPLPVKE